MAASGLLTFARSPGALCPNLQFASSAEELRTALHWTSPLATVGKREERRFLLVFTNLSLSLLDALREGTAACGAPRLLCPSRSGASSSKMQVDAPALLRPRRPGAAPYSHGDSGCIVTSIRRFLCTMMLLPPFMLGFSIFTFGPLSVACGIICSLLAASPRA